MSSELRHALTVDVEDYFQVAAFRRVVDPEDWDRFESRVERNTEKVLAIFAEHNVRATFFVLGWVAERYPGLVRRIYSAGHDLGCHSYAHRLVYELTPAQFRADTVRAQRAIEDASGTRVSSYRAPSFSITSRSLWAIPILGELGFTHDSSIFPVRHDLYGIPDAPHRPYRLRVDGVEMFEFPPSTIGLGRHRFPFTGGGYLRIVPFSIQRAATQWTERAGQPIMFYFHPWEVDPEQPRIAASLFSRFRTYANLSACEPRLRRLLQEFRFAPMSEVLSRYADVQKQASAVSLSAAAS